MDLLAARCGTVQIFGGFIYGHLENVAVLENKRLRILPIKIPPKKLGGIFMGRSTFGGLFYGPPCIYSDPAYKEGGRIRTFNKPKNTIKYSKIREKMYDNLDEFWHTFVRWVAII